MTASPDQPQSPDDQARLAAKLMAETAKIPWRDLQRFFAQGRAVEVQADTDLITVAVAISRGAAEQVEAWMAARRVRPVTDKQARRWLCDDALVWALVVRPWVLVQAVRE